jgi:hypothetical protein
MLSTAWDLCKYTVTLVLVCVKDFATKFMRSLLRRFDKQSNGQHARLLPKGPGDVWRRYFAFKMPAARSRITNSVLFKYCSELARVEGDEAATNDTPKYWLSRYGPTTSGVGEPSAEGILEALGVCRCDVAALNEGLSGDVLIGGSQQGARPPLGTTVYHPVVERSRKGMVNSWGVSSELRMDQRERGYIVQQVTEILLTKGASVVRKYTQGWKVFRLKKGQMRTIAQGKCEFLVGATELAAEGKRQYRLKAYFVPGPSCGVEWQEVRGGLSWCFGHILPPSQGQPILCRVLRVSWEQLQLPVFEGTAFATRAHGERPASVVGTETEMQMMATGASGCGALLRCRPGYLEARKASRPSLLVGEGGRCGGYR